MSKYIRRIIGGGRICLAVFLLSGTGCINSNPRIAVNILTSRSAATETSGSTNTIEAVMGMEGGGTVSPETTLTKP